MIRMIYTGLACLIGLFASTAQALTYQPMLDDDLLAQSPVVLRGDVIAQADEAGGLFGVTRYRVAVSRVYKGEVPVNEITLTLPGSVQALPGRRAIPGLPVFNGARDVVLFLSPGDQGDFRLVHLSLGAFFAARNALGEVVYQRQLGQTQALAQAVPRRGAVQELPRSASSFLGWLGEPSSEYAASTLLSDSGTRGTTQKDEFTTLGSPPSRWWFFDNGNNVNFRAHVSGQPGMTGGGFNQFQAAIAAWVNDSGSNIRYNYAGTTTATGGLNSSDGVNAILFNDPNDEVEGTFTCSAGGVLAIGGFVTNGNTRTHQGQVFGEITEGDIVTNNGAGCFFGMQNNTNGEEVFAHELGHTLGLGHSCEESGALPVIGIPLDPESCDAASATERDAIMKATPHADGRGADLRADDEAGAAFLYPNQGASTPDPDPTPTPDPSDDNGGNAGNGGGGGGGGCTVAAHGVFLDPLLPLLTFLALLTLLTRQGRAG